MARHRYEWDDSGAPTDDEKGSKVGVVPDEVAADWASELKAVTNPSIVRHPG
jgi:hypothetical protein